MSRDSIAILHPDFLERGGAEAVAMTVIETLQEQYDVTLYTFTPPDVTALNDYYGTSVSADEVAVEQVGHTVPWIYDHYGKYLGVLTGALFDRFARRHLSDPDLVFCTNNECSISHSIQYVHFPRYAQGLLPTELDDSRPVDRLYGHFCRFLGGVDTAKLGTAQVLANSEWTASVFESVYGVTPDVVYPPVNTSPFTAERREQREPGFVTVGRISPDKNLVTVIDIVLELVDRGFDTHLHVVGRRYENRFEDYYRRIEKRATANDCIHLEGELSHGELVSLLRSHRYGIHGKVHEHFGMVVAEFVAAGLLPFVPNSGGQREIVNDLAHLCYESESDAVNKASEVLRDDSLERRLRTALPDVEARYGRDRFKRVVRTRVEDALEESRGRV